MSAAPTVRCEAVVDLAAIRHNLRAVRGLVPAGVRVMAVVKAEGYGHGAVAVAEAAQHAGADMLGVATLGEALDLHRAGIGGRIACWLWVPADTDLAATVAAGVEIGISSREHLAAVRRVAALRASSRGGGVAVHLKLDSGLGRNGVGPAEFSAFAAAVLEAQRAGEIRVVGVMSHLASADVPGDDSVGEQQRTFEAAVRELAQLGISADRHLANTAGTIGHPELHHDMVRIGIGLYGFDPLGGAGPPAAPALRPAMTLRATVALTKRVPAGHGVSYGLTYRTEQETTLALIPLGYADGIPRAASGRAEVLVAGRRRRIAGRVAMDQFVVDCGDDPVAVGDEVLLFGPGDQGEPTATEWATACGTIDYEIVTRIGARVPRRWVGWQTARTAQPAETVG